MPNSDAISSLRDRAEEAERARDAAVNLLRDLLAFCDPNETISEFRRYYAALARLDGEARG